MKKALLLVTPIVVILLALSLGDIHLSDYVTQLFFETEVPNPSEERGVSVVESRKSTDRIPTKEDWAKLFDPPGSNPGSQLVVTKESGEVTYWEFVPRGMPAPNFKMPGAWTEAIYLRSHTKPSENVQKVTYDELWAEETYVDMDDDGKPETLGYLQYTYWENDQFVLSLEYALAKESLTLTAPIRVKDSRYGEPTPFEDFTWKNRDGRLFILTTVYDRQAVEHAVAYFANH